MTSSVTWLDTSAEQLKQAREIIALFTQQDSRDELGIGTVRDAFSNLMFPGTSVIQTRARYYLFIPWAYQAAKATGRTGDSFVAKSNEIERDLVLTLIREEPELGKGVIGRRVGRNVNTLPSAIYWNGMQTYRILNTTNPADIAIPRAAIDEATELAERQQSTLKLDTPRPPEGFPNETEGGFTLSAAEADWLRERILATCANTPLAALLEPKTLDAAAVDALAGCSLPWLHPDIKDDPRLEQARLFSECMHGASLLYNVLVAEACTAKGLGHVDGQAEAFHESLAEWSNSMKGLGGRLTGWDLTNLWSTVGSGGATIPLTTIRFVEAWVTEAQSLGRKAIADNQGMRRLVGDRERRKGSQSRLANDRMLPTWSGASGTGLLTYRWPNVRRIVQDVLEGVIS